jgi:DNA helicase II / ATP-dependent DNA helicase PcrA
MSILDGLNTAQRQAAEKIEGPMMVIAGAGSGKTRVLTFRIAHMISSGIDPFNILALTFTNKAAKEMKERIAKLMGSTEAKNIWMGTFHSIFARILRAEAEKIGYPQNFTIYDTQDSKNLLKAIIKEFGLDDKVYKVSSVYARISNAKNNLISPQAYMQNAGITGDDRSAGKPKMGEIYYTYAQRCFKAGAMDFDDLLFKTNVLLRDYPEVLLKYQDKFRYILVDEYQDTNYSQYLIVKRLAARFENICVVGDDAQSIYAFRGANIQNILNFKKDYPDYSLFKLEQNYRSTQNIVEAANSIILNNKDQIEKNVWTSNDGGEKITVYSALTDNEEGSIVARSIYDNIQNKQLKYSDFAILYRTNAQSRSFEEALRKLNIPYKIYGGLSFYQRKEIKDLIAYFRLVANPDDEEALKRVINYPKRGIGQTSFEKAIVAANEAQKSIWEVLCNPTTYPLGINSGALNKINDFITMIKSFQARMDKLNAFEMGNEIAISSGILKELYADKEPEGVTRYENIQELLNGLKLFVEENATEDSEPKLTDFLLDVALLTDADQEKKEDYDKVSLMTIHASKGLEYPYVYIVGLEENLFPSQLALNSRTELEEERRLFYVAVTRAEKQVYFSYAGSRYRWGNLIYCEPSRFIDEVDPKFLIMPENTKAIKSGTGDLPFETTRPKPQFAPKNLVKMSKHTASKGGAAIESLDDLQVGVTVEHERFGKGKIIAIEGAKPDTKATVYFPSSGQKTLLLKFAKLKVLN